eukprot:GHRR01005071.1.p3 GENE.GHRR01005071.1~~GHRR01005071.1.p3  ORF type:complete len:126 (+),score=25.72 GHRR01005071.1:567-944(+)
MQHKQPPAYDQLVQYRDQLATDLARVENQIAEYEFAYFNAEYSQAGNVLKGFEGFLSSKEALRKRQNRAWKPEDRLFSLSSKSSPVSKELQESEPVDGMASGGFGKKGYASKGYAQKGYAQKGKR